MKDISDEKVEKKLRANAVLDLDSMNDPDLIWAIGRYIERNSKHVARILFPWRPKGYVRATKDLGRYAENKATAMRCRLPGGTGIEAARGYELICDHIFDGLPAFARW